MFKGGIMNIEEIKNDKNVAFAIALKYSQLRRYDLKNLEISQFINFLFKYKWCDKHPTSVARAVAEIMNIDAGRIVAYLSNEAVIKSQYRNLGDFKDLFAGELK